ncbi:Rho termination factor N-terminal domain-containing protein [Arsenicicoccus cauae]|uniref:Rho termination factor N-terminal domain-containing protein n=1 Tax=Arsenicicoccus cauae TaxID=2663847 RepID=UPI00370D2853
MAPSEDASKDQRQDDPGPSVRDKELYETLRDEGNSKEKSARIANAAAAQGHSTVGARGGEHGSYDDWTKDELLDRAREVGIEGRSSMNKDELIDALREH